MSTVLDTEHMVITCSAGKVTLFSEVWTLSERLATVKTAAKLSRSSLVKMRLLAPNHSKRRKMSVPASVRISLPAAYHFI